MVVEVQGIPVNYIVCGEGPETAVILQGWGTKLGLYRDLAEHLGRTMRVFLPELPGFGETPEPPEAWDAEDYAAFVLKLLEALDVEKTHLIGHSNGGRIMLVLASEKRKADFGKLVFMDAAGVVPRPTAKKKLRTFTYKLGKLFLSPFPAALERFRQKRGSADYRAASPVMRATLVKLVNRDLTALMPSIPNPSLLIWGEKDADTPLWMGRVFEEKIPDAGLVTVPGAGHYAYLEQPGFVFRVLDSFFGAN
ncbi:MAG: alpha/beta hydrolase [Oscillospiraceae bacterium]|nr:alpha/beta hydrolase [Oscillospiraceae bacterium]